METEVVSAQRHSGILFESECRVVDFQFAPSRSRRGTAPSLRTHTASHVGILQQERHVESAADVHINLAEEFARSLRNALHRGAAARIRHQRLIESILVHPVLTGISQCLIDGIHVSLCLVESILSIAHITFLDERPFRQSRPLCESEVTAVCPRNVKHFTKFRINKRVDIFHLSLCVCEIRIHIPVHHNIKGCIRLTREIVAASTLLISYSHLAILHKHITLLRHCYFRVTIRQTSGTHLVVACHTIHCKGVCLHIVHIHYVC